MYVGAGVFVCICVFTHTHTHTHTHTRTHTRTHMMWCQGLIGAIARTTVGIDVSVSMCSLQIECVLYI